MSHSALQQESQSGNQNAEPEKNKQANDLPVGEILRRTRIHYKKSIQDVEAVLRIKAIQIEAIEQGNHEFLPARVYAIGFVRTYARYLGLDENYIVEMFKRQSIATAPTPDLNFPVSVEQSTVPSWWLVAASVAILILAPTVYFQLKGGSDQYEPSIPPITEELTNSNDISLDSTTITTVKNEVPTKADVATLNPSNVSPPEEIPSNEVPSVATEEAEPPVVNQPREGVVLTILDNSWVEIRNAEGKRLVSRVLKAGEEYFVPDRPGLTMSLGNAGGVQVSVNGETLAPLGEDGTVIRNIPLQASALKNLEKDR